MENKLSHALLSAIEHDWVVKDIAKRGNVRKALLLLGQIEEDDLTVPIRYELFQLHSLIATQELTDVIMTITDRVKAEQTMLHVNMKLLGSGSFLARTSTLR